MSQAHASTSSAKQQNLIDLVGDDDEEAIGPSGSSASHLMTQHEVAEADIVVPQITEVGPHEVLEPVGEVMSIVNNVVIVKGTASGTVRANERALDSETLLVFEDRQVLGYVSKDLNSYKSFGYRYACVSTDLRDVWADESTTLPGQVQPVLSP